MSDSNDDRRRAIHKDGSDFLGRMMDKAPDGTDTEILLTQISYTLIELLVLAQAREERETREPE